MELDERIKHLKKQEELRAWVASASAETAIKTVRTRTISSSSASDSTSSDSTMTGSVFSDTTPLVTSPTKRRQRTTSKTSSRERTTSDSSSQGKATSVTSSQGRATSVTSSGDRTVLDTSSSQRTTSESSSRDGTTQESSSLAEAQLTASSEFWEISTSVSRLETIPESSSSQGRATSNTTRTISKSTMDEAFSPDSTKRPDPNSNSLPRCKGKSPGSNSTSNVFNFDGSGQDIRDSGYDSKSTSPLMLETGTQTYSGRNSQRTSIRNSDIDTGTLTINDFTMPNSKPMSKAQQDLQKELTKKLEKQSQRPIDEEDPYVPMKGWKKCPHPPGINQAPPVNIDYCCVCHMLNPHAIPSSSPSSSATPDRLSSATFSSVSTPYVPSQISEAWSTEVSLDESVNINQLTDHVISEKQVMNYISRYMSTELVPYMNVDRRHSDALNTK